MKKKKDNKLPFKKLTVKKIRSIMKKMDEANKCPVCGREWQLYIVQSCPDHKRLVLI
jgi:hypothetical protein